ncbi:response regulator transcription factor [Exilibacterium tricleocarpae]|uniref:Response regulator transcription factor n=1 Tax=Exilibacterium tricleocarpae TaxID=2591008 RepID=A0A545U3T8_9GAMM|nr:response regulator transcription factor [Exilibacterium tricleocarpae]TQV84073.1 response regulator transcription factor [Exilibacterium tricleocarpae]
MNYRHQDAAPRFRVVPPDVFEDFEHNPIKVVLLADHPISTAGIRSFTSQEKWINIIGEASDADQAEAILAKEDVDLIIVDIMNSDTGGPEFITWIRKSHARVKTILLSSCGDIPFVLRVLKSGANGFLLDNISEQDFITTVKHVMKNKNVYDPEIISKLVSLATRQSAVEQKSIFTKREKETLRLVSKGLTNKDIGERLHISSRTVQGNLSRIYTKLDVNTRTEAVIKAIKMGLLMEPGKTASLNQLSSREVTEKQIYKEFLEDKEVYKPSL